jgi:NAD(P)-dependent dehydrogenase (short-subunit alcohol dehydrogenase family)
MAMSRFLDGRVAVVTGAAHGIGAAGFVACDVAQAAACTALVRCVMGEHGRIDVALEGAPYDIRVNAVLPGATDTPMLQREAKSSGDPAALLAAFAAAQPMGRLVRPEEVACVAAFLASDAASGVTGSCVAADGGLMAAINAAPGISYTAEST